jgi:hypothetical protein
MNSFAKEAEEDAHFLHFAIEQAPALFFGWMLRLAALV